uniref:Uncharacterized protein n=1 Tax=Anguilla anguilla TaxID=7936 RepID=A0A0E9XF18_ANGAN
MEANPGSNALTSSMKPSQKSGGCYSSKGWNNSILMPIILDKMLDVRCPNVVYIPICHCL